MGDIINTKKCLNCAEDLKNEKGKRSKVFCNSTCRSNYWQRARKLEQSGMSDEAIVAYMAKNFAYKRAIRRVAKDITKPSTAKSEAAKLEEDMIDYGMAVYKTTSEGVKRIDPLGDEANIVKRIAELEKEIKNPPKNPLIGLKMYLSVREKELKELRAKLP